MILPLILNFATITGDEAIKLAKQALRDLEVKGPYRLQGLSGAYQNGDRSRWHLKLSADAFTFEVAITEAGRIRYIERTDFGGFHEDKIDSTLAAKSARWLAKIKPAIPVRPLSGRDFGGSTTYYEGLAAGYPVVYPRTSLGYLFMVRNGTLLSFRASEEPPALGNTTPKLSEKEALQSVDRIFKSENPPKGAVTYSYQLSGSPELGWAVPVSGSVARLAWRVPFMFERSGPLGSQGGSDGMLVDAITGEKIPTPTVP